MYVMTESFSLTSTRIESAPDSTALWKISDRKSHRDACMETHHQLNLAMMPGNWSLDTFPNTSPPTVNTGARPQQPTQRDRKSTRLNSSHVRISYAVFGLNKKNKFISV